MSMISTSFLAISNEAEKKVQETQRSHKLYYRESTGEYIVASPGSSRPPNSNYQGRWMWDGKGVRFVSGSNEPTRLE